MARARRYAAGIFAVVFCTALASNCSAQQASKGLLRRLAAPISARWSDAPARQAIERLAAETEIAIWIDRHVDARKEFTLAATNKPIATLIDDMAASLDMGAATIDNVVYVGPANSAVMLPTLAKQWRRGAPSALRKRTPLEWARLTEPRKLVEEIASSAGYSIENPKAIAHDLWPAGSIPPIAMGDQLTLLCLGFDLRWTVTDRTKKTIRLEPIDDAPSRKPATLASLIDSKPAPQGENRYTLRIAEQPIGPVLKQLATQLGLELDASVDAELLNQRVSFEVKQATLEELFQAASKAANLDIHATGAAIIVRPRP